MTTAIAPACDIRYTGTELPLGKCITVDPWGDPIEAFIRVITGIDPRTRLEYFQWEVRTRHNELLTGGAWTPSLMEAWCEAIEFKADRSKVLVALY